MSFSDMFYKEFGQSFETQLFAGGKVIAILT